MLGCGAPTPPAGGAIVTFAFHNHPADTLKVLVTRAETIETVEEILAGSRPALMPLGLIRRGPGVDPRYPFHFIPESVRLADLAIELCDGAPMRTPAEVEAFIAGATGSPTSETATWCPWGGYPVHLERH